MQLSDCTSKDFSKFTSERTELPQYAALLAVGRTTSFSPKSPQCMSGITVSYWAMGWADTGCSSPGLLIVCCEKEDISKTEEKITSAP